MRMRTKVILSIVPVFVLYFTGPLTAGLFGIGDREGPRIYLVEYHTELYKITYQMSHDEKARMAIDAGETERPLFYGLPRTRR